MIDPKLNTFINIGKLKSFTKTAELLHLTQPAISQHIKQLEEYYKVKLILKKGRQISLTEEGEMLLKYAKGFEANSLLLKRQLKNQSSFKKRYHIGATLTIGEFILPPLLGKYRILNDNIDIILNVKSFEDILIKLNSGEIDLGIVEGPFDKSKFNYKKLRDDELVFVTSSQSNLSNKLSIDINEIINNGSLILREKGSGTRMVFENKIFELGYTNFDLKIYMEVGSIGAIKSLVKANLGHTVISIEAVKREVLDGDLTVIPIKDFKIMREFNFIFLDNSPKDFIENFIQFLSTQQ